MSKEDAIKKFTAGLLKQNAEDDRKAIEVSLKNKEEVKKAREILEAAGHARIIKGTPTPEPVPEPAEKPKRERKVEMPKQPKKVKEIIYDDGSREVPPIPLEAEKKEEVKEQSQTQQ